VKKAAIIQVRIDSSRFPGKALKPILNKPLLWHVINRTKAIGIPVIVATTKRHIDDPLVKIALDCDVDIFRGSLNDCLDRYYQAAKEFSLTKIFRVSADSPLIDPHQSSKVVKELNNNNFDYVKMGSSFPIGTGIEGFTFKSLEQTWEKTTSHYDREHVTSYIKAHPKDFRILVIESNYHIDEKHWTVEYPKDIEYVREIFSKLKNKNIFYTEDILQLIKENSSLSKFNSFKPE